MKEKEQLLSMDEPLRFIFNHSAWREGWDNPNVFQICTLSQTQSAVKKRQEIGRGLRLPVHQSGRRVFDESVNKLCVMANESYEDFARALQSEYEEDCGVPFGKVPLTALAKITRVVDGTEKGIGRVAAETYDRAAGLAGMGFTAIKLGWGPLGRSRDRDIAPVCEGRRGAGADVDLMIDAGQPRGLAHGASASAGLRRIQSVLDRGTPAS